MMYRRIVFNVFSFLLLSLPFILQAQEGYLNIKDTRNPAFYPKSVYGLQFMGESNQISYSKTGTDLWKKDEKGNETKILEVSELSPAPRHLLGLTYKNDHQFIYQSDNGYYLFDLNNKTSNKLSAAPEGTNILEFDDATLALVYLKDSNLWVNYNNRDYAITKDGSRNIIYGEAVHRNEFGINKGTFLSPKGNAVAFYRMDQSMVTDYPLVNTSERIATYTPIKYPMAGMKSHEVTLAIHHFHSGKTIGLDTYRKKPADVAEREMFLTNITWSPDEKYIFIAKLNRDQNHVWIEKYDAQSGNFLGVLFEEQGEKYVEPENGLFFLPDNSGDFLWLSERDGWNHFYWYDQKGNLKKQLTSGKWMITEVKGFDKTGKNLFFYATKDSPLEQNLYKIELKSGKITRITTDAGTHDVHIHPSGELFLDTYSNYQNIASKTVLRNAKGAIVRELFEADDPLKDLFKPTIEIGEIKAKDGTKLYTRMIKPHDFDPSKKYPVLVYVYGGPHAQLITDSWLGGANLFFLYLAQQGYIVWTVDNRGSANRGYEFESAIWHNTGSIEVSDQMDGVNYLKGLSFVDTNRIGVDGWSYGGFMTISLILKNPGVFKVATAGGPVIDWKWYEVMYGERYMGHPDKNQNGYKNSSLLNYVDNLDTRLMIIHGAQDNTVLWQHSLEFINMCIKKGKLVDYFVYPDHEHNVLGKDRIHLYMKLFDYYETFLK